MTAYTAPAAPTAMEKYRALLEESQEKLKEMDAYVEQIAAKPTQLALVVNVTIEKGERFAYVLMGGIMRLPISPAFKLESGDTVTVVPGRGIVARMDAPRTTGPVATVKSIVDEATIEIDNDGAPTVVTVIKRLEGKLVEGDRVMLDSTEHIILRLLPKPPAPVADIEVERVTWEQVSGHKLAKQAIERAVVWPRKHGSIMKAYGQRDPGGILLWGPPGCGKTLLAKATATELAANGDAPGFFSVRGPELMNMYVGETERMIRALFTSAREHQKQTGTRGVVFIDEADSCLGHRGKSLQNDISVPAFLVEMDGIDARYKPLVILATNRPTDLDDAIVREGRVDTRIEIQRPNVDEVQALFHLYLKARPCKGPLDSLTSHCASYIEDSPLWPVRSGALVASIVDRVTAVALERDIAKNATRPSGITIDDCTTAITMTAIQRNL